MLEIKSASDIDLVILAGGKGSRIKNFLGNYPKPLLKFNKKHFIQYILNTYCKYNFKRIIILCGYRSKFFFTKFHKKKINLTEIICLKEKVLLGTGGALFKLKKLKVKSFFLTNGDSILDIDIFSLTSVLKKNSVASIALLSNRGQKSNKLNNLDLKNSYLTFKKNGKLMNGGLYFFKKTIFKYLKNKHFSLENDLLPKLILSKKINGKVYNNFFIDIGSEKYLKIAGKKLKKNFIKPAVFLDRDGVINYDYGYVHNIKKFRFRTGVIKGLKYLLKKNFYIFVVTNQAGIAKKKFTENDFFKLHSEINKRLAKCNVFFNDVQFSPFHPNAKIKKYKKNSNLRKPGNKMIENLKNNWDINLSKSFMIGDKLSDGLAAKKSGLKFLYSKGNFYKQVKLKVN